MSPSRKKTRIRTRSLFVTGTDTGVGKTYISVAIASHLSRTRDVGVMKPLATGSLSDSRQLRAAAGVDDDMDLITPLHFPTPLSPNQASRRPIDMKPVWAAWKTLRKRHRTMIVEGIGGLLVPIRGTYTVADMIKRLRLPILIVARPTLGTLNHTALTVEAARKRGLKILGVVVNHHRRFRASEAVRKNPDAIAKQCRVPVFVVRHGEARSVGRIFSAQGRA